MLSSCLFTTDHVTNDFVIVCNRMNRRQLANTIAVSITLSYLKGWIKRGFNFTDLVSAAGSVSRPAFGSSQIRFPGPAPFTSCQLLGKG